jgi:TRAP-type C4-dicarboxylate transport system permease small subunit
VNVLKKIAHIYNKAEEYFVVYTILLAVILIFYQVVMRYVFNNSPTWTEEICRYLFVWQVWLGASLGQRENRHIRVDLLANALKNREKFKIEHILEIFILIVWLGFSVALTYGGATLVGELISRGAVSPGLRFPMWIAYSAVPLGCAALCFRLVYSIYIEVKETRQGGLA